MASLTKTGYVKSGNSANCYPMACDPVNKRIVVTFAQGTSAVFTANCTAAAGGPLTVNKNGYTGTVTCPSYVSYCGNAPATGTPPGTSGTSTGTTGSGTSTTNTTVVSNTTTTTCPKNATIVCRTAGRQCGSVYDTCKLLTVQCGNNGLCALSTQVCQSGVCVTRKYDW
eukprot:Opistho-2@22565